MTALENIRAYLSSVSTTTDVKVKALHLAIARSLLEGEKDGLATAERLLVAQERELARIGGSK